MFDQFITKKGKYTWISKENDNTVTLHTNTMIAARLTSCHSQGPSLSSFVTHLMYSSMSFS
jgi:hypothetical protein